MHRNLRHFRYEHLRDDLQPTVKLFAELAQHIATSLPENDETREAMRRLVEAKDWAVRGQLAGPDSPPG